MNPLALLPFFSTLAGGYAALRLRHRLHAVMALAAGVVVATAVADLLPEAFELAGEDNVLGVGIAAVLGFIGFSFVEAFLHQSSFEHAGARGHEHRGIPVDAADDHEHRSGHDHGAQDHSAHDAAASGATADATARNGTSSPSGFLAVLPPLSLIVHSTLDGLAIGLAFQAGAEIGLIVLLAVLAHDFADGMNVVTLVLDAARGERLAVGLLLLDAIAPLAGAALSTVISIEPSTLGLLLAGFGGVFIAIGAGHLLPESQHRDPGHSTTMVALAGVGAAIVLVIRALAPV
ncbi:MAG TPA: ZIP family metal transporter [Candidatus Limnocylindria bacterium]|nr:ZIP family metal transporter [Candidatus Limnocylindria bacterium]